MSSTEFAKTHLREHLVSLIIPPVSDGFWSIYDSAKEVCERNGQLDQVLRTFQNMLTKIPEWTDTTLTTEVDRIVKITKCSYMDDLLMGVFISYMRSFASLHYRGSSSEIKIDFNRPSFAKFIHELYKHSGRKLWQVAYYFKTIGVSSEQQARNRQDIESVVTECMEQVIRGFLPWEAIAKKYFADDEEDDSAPAPTPALPKPAPTPSRPDPVPAKEEPKHQKVQFDELEDDDDTDYDEDEDLPIIKLSDETAELDVKDFEDKKPEVAVVVKLPEIPKEEDPLKELESRASESLVLNL
jgi:hypothetical protein